ISAWCARTWRHGGLGHPPGGARAYFGPFSTRRLAGSRGERVGLAHGRDALRPHPHTPVRGAHEERHISMSFSLGRPLVVVYEDPEKLPNLNLVVRNVGSGPARSISFEFSAPIESSDGFVLSELPVFAEGMTSLAPGAKLTCYWDDLGDLLSRIEEGKIARHVEVTTHYEDLTGAPTRPPGTSSPTSMRASATSTTRASMSSWRLWRG